ncbi:MAG: hypothetical protein ACTS7C_00475, partial [Candidatus Hodgkinia cicadicola]
MSIRVVDKMVHGHLVMEKVAQMMKIDQSRAFMRTEKDGIKKLFDTVRILQPSETHLEPLVKFEIS